MRDYYITCPKCGREFSFEYGEWDTIQEVTCPVCTYVIELEWDTMHNDNGEWQVCGPKKHLNEQIIKRVQIGNEVISIHSKDYWDEMDKLLEKILKDD